jgi:hypothetical protein
LDGLGGVFGCKPAHNQGQLAVGRRLYRSSINPLDVLGGKSTATIHFHDKLCGFHAWFYFTPCMLFMGEIPSGCVEFDSSALLKALMTHKSKLSGGKC